MNESDFFGEVLESKNRCYFYLGVGSEVKFHESVLAFHHGDLILPSLPREAFSLCSVPQPKKCEIM